MNSRRQLLFLVTSFIILSILTCSKLVLTYFSTGNATQTTLAKQYITIAKDMADGLDKSAYEQFLQTKQPDSAIIQYLEEYRSRIHALYVYTLQLDDTDVAKVMLSAVPTAAELLPIGSPCTVPSKQVNQAKDGLAYYTDIIKDETHGVYLSVGVPIVSESGKLLGVMAIDIDASQLESISQEVINSSKVIFTIDILFAVLLLLAFFVLRKWHKTRLKQDLYESEQIYISEMGKVIDSIKSSRHDRMNHLQVLHGLLTLKKYDRATDYLKELAGDSKALDLSMKVNNPVILILFQSKWELAQSKGIEMQFETDSDEFSKIESMDLVKIFSNLLDNAIEAAEVYEGKLPRRILVASRSKGGKTVYTVENPAILNAKDQKHLFHTDGYTTKKNPNAMRGNGLSIITKTVHKYNGDIRFRYDNETAKIQITI